MTKVEILEKFKPTLIAIVGTAKFNEMMCRAIIEALFGKEDI